MNYVSITDDASDEELPLAAIRDYPRFVGLHRHWEERRAGRLMPAWRELAPEALQPFLGYIVVVDVEVAPRRFRFRRVGSEIAAAYGRDLSGSYTDHVKPLAYRLLLEREYGQAVERRQPVVHRLRFVEWTGQVHELIRLALPLADDAATVNMLVLASMFGPGLVQRRAEATGGDGLR